MRMINVLAYNVLQWLISFCPVIRLKTWQKDTNNNWELRKIWAFRKMYGFRGYTYFLGFSYKQGVCLYDFNTGLRATTRLGLWNLATVKALVILCSALRENIKNQSVPAVANEWLYYNPWRIYFTHDQTRMAVFHLVERK